MENAPEHNDKENSERRNSNTEYLPTKCRITKPPPPKPAANPLQFIKISPPSQLYKKAQEQIKKVEETKVARQEVREEAEDWQANLDNWKSSRRKLQEHIIERVVEVKKFEQDGSSSTTRKHKTFNEMMEERSRGRHKFNIPVYNDDDSNDLSDYGIGSSSSKTNSIKDVDTDDSISNLDEKEHESSQNSTGANQNQSDEENQKIQKTTVENNNFINSRTSTKTEYKYQPKTETYSSTLYSNISTNKPFSIKTSMSFDSKFNEPETEKYTYEGAIQDYRSRIKSRINIDESVFNKPQDVAKSKEFSEVQSLLPKGNLFKRKEIFEADKNSDGNSNDTSRRFSEDFANAQSIKERLKSLEKCVDQPVSSDKSSPPIVSVKSRVQSFDKPIEEPKPTNGKTKEASRKTICSYLMQESSSASSIETTNKNGNDWKTKDILSDRSSSPEAELYMDKLNMMNQDFDNLMYGRLPRVTDNNMEYRPYTASSSSTEIMAMSSDREDSGIHTADVSCSVSQADDQFDESEMPSNTIPNCIEKLNQENVKTNNEVDRRSCDLSYNSSIPDGKCEEENCPYLKQSTPEIKEEKFNKEYVVNATEQFLFDAKNDSTQNKEFLFENQTKQIQNGAKTSPSKTSHIQNGTKSNQNVSSQNQNVLSSNKNVLSQNQNALTQIQNGTKPNQNLTSFSKPIKNNNKPSMEKEVNLPHQTDNNKKALNSPEKLPKSYENVQINIENKVNVKETTPRIYENVIIMPESKTVYENIDFMSGDILAPPKMKEPPKVKPPPPPPVETSETDSVPQEPVMKRLNSTKRIKKEIQIKRSSFLGLEEPVSLVDADLSIEKPPDVDLFLKQESRLEKSFYKKLQGSREGGLSEVDSQDSGLEVDRGRLSSDTWCSVYPESGNHIHHGRQDSEQTNSYTSEEEEIMKKEREIIAMVEKEEKCRDTYPTPHYTNNFSSPTKRFPEDNYEITLGSEEFKRPYVRPHQDDLDGPDSEVLKVEHELLQLEREELERQQENMLFRENQIRKHNRYSLENICDANPRNYTQYDYRKSMPELQHLPADFRKSIPDVPGYRLPQPTGISYHKSMPDIQHAYSTSMTEYPSAFIENNLAKMDHQKSMPDLDHDVKPPIFRPPPPVTRQQPVMSSKVIRPFSADQRDKKMMEQNAAQQQIIKRRPISAHNIHSLGAPPKPRPIPNDMWIQPKPKAETKNYNQHWLYQEAELRRLSEMNKSWPNGRPNGDKHIPDAVIHTLTQRIQNRPSYNDPRTQQNPRDLRPDASPSKEAANHSYVNHPQTMGHALPMSCPNHVENQDKVLSVSGKKKCSYCNNELGRGAAMIIESLCLFYHMDCFKCCVCHTQLGDGFMGTDVRVRNQKLHCHNCYSSDDGVKFSCV